MRLAALPLALCLTGCASTLSTLQTARPVEKGHVQVTGGIGWYLPVGPVISAIGQGIKQADAGRKALVNNEPYALAEEDQQELLTAGVALAVMPPWQGYEISVRTGAMENLDVGVRYSVNAVRVDGKYRFFHRGDDPPQAAPDRPSAAVSPHARRSVDMALGLGVSRYLFENPVFKVLEFVHLDDFSRWDIEAPLYISAEMGEFLKLYAAPKYVYSRTSFDERLVFLSEQATNVSGVDLTLPAKVDSHFVGLSAGLGVGYKWVHLMLELTSGWLFCKAPVLGETRSLGGPTFYPAAGIALSF